MKLGSSDISKIYLGSTEVSKAYLGATQVYGGSQPLPYDAEIEYLQSDGNQYIATDYTTNADSIIIVTAQLTTLEKQNRIIGNVTGYFEVYVNGSNNWGSSSNGGTGGPGQKANTSKHVFKIDNVAKKAYVDTLSWNINKNGSSYYGKTELFGRGSSPGTISTGYLYDAKIYDGSVLVHDFIPVRVGQVGYLYDKVGRTLYGNSGTGSFTLGPDKT